MPVNIQIARRAELNQELQRVERVLNNPTPVWEPVVRKVLIPSIRETFLSEGGGRWARRLGQSAASVIAQVRDAL